MPDDKVPCCMADAARRVRKITLPGDNQVGITKLDEVLEEVLGLGLEGEEAIRAELLSRIKVHNYVPRSGEADYATALFNEYMRLKG